MKITYIVLKDIPYGGGIENYTEEVGSRLASRGHHVTVFSMRQTGNRDKIYRGMHIKTVPTVPLRGIDKLLGAFIASIMSLSINSDVVHFHAFGPAIFSFVHRLFGRRVVVQGHGIEWKRSRWGFWGQLILKLTEWPSVILPHIVTVVSNVQKIYIHNRYKRDCVYIPTGVNPPQMEEPDLIEQYGLGRKNYILFASRLVHEKGAHYLIKAFSNINTDLKLVIAGDALHEDRYKEYLRRIADNNSRIIFTGYVKGKLLRELFSNLYLFVLPSEVEGLPTVLLEAMSYGGCCLTSNIPENIEAMGSFGYSFENKNVTDLTNKLKYLIENKSKVREMEDKARSYVLDNFSWDSISQKFEDLYMTLLTKY